jgi:hypothetical protein
VALLDLIRFTVIRQGRIVAESGEMLNREEFNELTDRLADELMDTANVQDQSLGANLETAEVELSVDVLAENVGRAVEVGDAAIRTALHAAMVSTLEWTAAGGLIEVDEEDWPAVLAGGRISVEPADLIDA